ncbi:hypothetical protein TMatcc_007473 [Talaromyces marneffei ATCC 18224]|uniref:FUN14 family protein n=2 Tax=Talaromyces marneffei TaxID=37727 RepID=B6QFZ8_TALMQ|nr:uncharacterized protein EYB26_004433 [Talaromyces marneffei]EEA24383.1 conserved hypothetical protein [Talaromyces marneffei ATCC 18224]KAE8553106.1 hypothetical protein EYB25_004485 [Talaromyces marneffei]QGA16763.1 hypothetical protein EYB26_004433 [Talaromyces marneffei]
MAFLFSSLRPILIGTGIGLSLLVPSSPFRSAPIQCQYTAPYYNQHASPESGWSLAGSELAAKQGRTSSSQPGTGLLNARCMRQISLGSVLGLATGLGLRVFSKALVFVLGVGIVLIEWAASKGYNIIPVNTLQKYVKSFDLQRATRENVPFKVSFGTTMAFAAFASFTDYS